MDEERKNNLLAFQKKYERHFNSLLLSFLAGIVKRRYIPSLQFNLGTECFTDHSRIVIGLDQKWCTNEVELYAFVYYVLGHEVQHILSTTPKPWEWGINTGIKYIVGELMKFYGYPPTTLIGEDVIKSVLLKMAKDGHPVPQYEQIGQFCHFVCNAVEDGRIERHRSGVYPGYGKYVRLFRGRMWLDNAEPGYDMPLSAENRLSLYSNEILSLATTQVFEKNFWEYYFGTPEEKLLSSQIREHVAKAVYSRSCKGCMEHCVEIVRILTPNFIDAVKSDPSLTMLRSLLEAMMSQILNGHGAEGFSEMKEGDEEDANGNGTPVFGKSALGNPDVDENGDITGKINTGKPSDEDGEGEGDGKEKSTGNGGKDDNCENAQSAQGKAPVSPDGTNKKGSRKAGSTEGVTYSENDIERKMEDAANKIAEDISASDGNKMSDGNKTADGPDQYDPSSDAQACADMHKIKFHEVQRKYRVDIPLPFIIQEQGRSLYNKIKDRFKPKKTGLYRRKTSGRVDGDNIHKLAMKETDCFALPQKPDKFEGCCYVLQDNSGSMGGGRNSKRQFASEASARIEYAFKTLMPLKIVAFDNYGDTIHEVIKNWNDRMSCSGAYNFFHRGREGGGNNDADSILIATEELIRRKERNKILIVISDGLPCGSQAYQGVGPENAVKLAVENARRHGIKVVGIYIEEVVNNGIRSRYEDMYGLSCVFTDTDHISDELAKVMSSWVFSN